MRILSENKKGILFMYTNFYYTAMFHVVELAFRMSFCFEGYKEDDMFNDSTWITLLAFIYKMAAFKGEESWCDK